MNPEDGGATKRRVAELRLTAAEWTRVLKEARRVAAGLAARRRHFELEGGVVGDGREDAFQTAEFIRDRVEVHIGTIKLMRPLRTSEEPLVGVLEEVRVGLEELVGPERTRKLLEVDLWRVKEPGSP